MGYLDLSPANKHNKIRGIPNTMNIPIVRIRIRKTNKNIPKHNIDIPRVKIQGLVTLSTIYRIQAPLSPSSPSASSFAILLLVVLSTAVTNLFRFLPNFLISSSMKISTLKKRVRM
jgi:hypothetical protein